MTERKPYAITVQDLVARDRDDIPAELVTSTHLIYNSPAALAFNSPGAQGFGVKRAGLSIPGSVMLLVGPGCCGRNTTILSEMGGYSDRFFFYIMDETDIVTGRHLKKIPQAVCEVVDSLAEKPSVVMICMTCVDALLGTDMERVCRKAEKEAGLPVVPCYMYALTREGRKPPMVDVRRAIYSLLEKQPRRRRTVNLLGYFAPLQDDCELYDILRGVGFNQINEISRCPDFAAYKAMSQANVNIILNPEARLAAQDMEKRLGIPSIELTRLYQVAQIHKQYQALAQVLGTTIDNSAWHERAQAVVRAVREKYSGTTVAIGEMQNGNAFEMALALTRYGFVIREIYANLGPDDFVYLRHLAQLSPDTQVYSNLSPSMLYYRGQDHPVDVTIGKDAAYYHEQLALRKEHDPVTSLTNELYAIFMCHLMAGSQEAVKYTKLLLEDVKKAPKSEGLHILWMHMMPFLQEPVKDIFNYSDQIHISACDFVADGFQKTHYEDPYESMAEKMVNCIYNGSVKQRIQKAKELAAQTNVDGGILFTHWGCKGTIGASSLIKGSLEEAGIPTMILDGDGCNPANSSDGQISTRLQAYMEMLKVNKAEKYAANHGKGAGSDDTLCL